MTENETMTEHAALPYFPAPAPSVFTDAEATRALLAPVLAALATVVEIDDDALDGRTPCASYTVSELRDHVLGWLQFFAAALADPSGRAERLDPEAYRAIADDRAASAVVAGAAETIDAAVAGGVLGQRVAMSQAAMDGGAVLAMALGEYLAHGWDLAVATGRDWTGADDACDAAREFLTGMISDEYRSADGAGGMFGPEVAVPEDASALVRLLGYTGRDPHWTR